MSKRKRKPALRRLKEDRQLEVLWIDPRNPDSVAAAELAFQKLAEELLDREREEEQEEVD